jgi:hypothetical protein
VPLHIDGVEYQTISEILVNARITRQTLWRWRQEGRIPLGRRYRDRQLLFTSDEAVEIQGFANRVEPVSSPTAFGQMGLFSNERNRQEP